MQKTLVIATGNPGKIIEIKALLNHLGLIVISTQDLGVNLDVEETGGSYAANARLKAKAYQKATREIVLADDTGLEVAVLNGAPGIYSARYAPQPNATDADRRAYLLEQLQGKAQPWRATFTCTAVLALPDGRIIETVGQCDGEIIPEERGTGGFGYDPIFYLPDYQATTAEISPALKNQISHRAKAIIALIPAIKEIFKLD